MNFNIYESMQILSGGLHDYFTSSPFRFKGSDDPLTFESATPTIYEWCDPVNDRNNSNFPNKTPCITLVLESITPAITQSTARITAHCCVVNPAISDAEKVKFNAETGAWEFLTTSTYTQSESYVDLYKASLLLGTETINAIMRLSRGTLSIDDVSFTPPDPNLQDFPFSACAVSFNIIFKESIRAYPEDFRKYL
jgi:hypothetical protein